MGANELNLHDSCWSHIKSLVFRSDAMECGNSRNFYTIMRRCGSRLMLNYCIGTTSGTTKQIDSFTGALTTMLPELKAFAHSLCSNTPVSDDLVQETLLRAWSARAQFS